MNVYIQPKSIILNGDILDLGPTRKIQSLSLLLIYIIVPSQYTKSRNKTSTLEKKKQN